MGNQLVYVTLSQEWAGKNEGETILVDAQRAEQLVKDGLAEKGKGTKKAFNSNGGETAFRAMDGKED